MEYSLEEKRCYLVALIASTKGPQLCPCVTTAGVAKTCNLCYRAGYVISCPLCDGAGLYNNKRCKICRGMGLVRNDGA